MKVSIIGAGYVGVITALGFGELGHEVMVMDQDVNKINQLVSGQMPFYERGAQESLQSNISAGKVHFTCSMSDVIEFAELIFLCVGTPPLDDGSADLSAIESIARTIAEQATSAKCLVEKSTVPAGTSQWIERTLRLYGRNGVTFYVASNPEFLQEGNALDDFLNPSRIVIGVKDDYAKDLLLELYRDLDSPKLVCDIETAELIKHASNSFLAMKISYINLVADLCERVGADVRTVAYGIGLDPRIGSNFLNAGLGYGGSCFPKDTKAFVHMARTVGLDFSLLERVDLINRSRVDVILSKLRATLWSLKGKRITILGLAFKPHTDDVREAPALRIISKLLDEGAIVSAYDPKASHNARGAMIDLGYDPSEIRFTADSYEALEDSHALVIATEWPDFAELDPDRIYKLMRTPIIVDGRNLLIDKDLGNCGFEYYPIGIAK